ncbi:MEI2-like protein 5 [Striga asiatica]|uniref:MEI2-like protein 5 n=1 Tax=Striga asiatica TaxID=4170 RepID=A0A5A7P491_STRAF|nr:MEI2-like protein 5 [Striga asiatica]
MAHVQDHLSKLGQQPPATFLGSHSAHLLQPPGGPKPNNLPHNSGSSPHTTPPSRSPKVPPFKHPNVQLPLCDFCRRLNGKQWKKFNSEKVASLAYARIE